MNTMKNTLITHDSREAHITYGFTCHVTDQKALKLSQMSSLNFAANA